MVVPSQELTYVARFFAQVYPAMPCVRRYVCSTPALQRITALTRTLSFWCFACRGLVETVINSRADRAGIGSNDTVAQMAAGHLLVYGIVAVGAQLSK